jgi:hypothetical protein
LIVFPDGLGEAESLIHANFIENPSGYP